MGFHAFLRRYGYPFLGISLHVLFLMVLFGVALLATTSGPSCYQALEGLCYTGAGLLGGCVAFDFHAALKRSRKRGR